MKRGTARTSTISVVAGCLILSIFLAGCGGGRSPTSPSDPTGLPVTPPPSPGALVAPEGLDIEDDFSVGRAALRLSWSPIPEAASYVIQVGSTPYTGSADLLEKVVDAPNAVLEVAPQNSAAYVKVRAARGAERGPPSADCSAPLFVFEDAVEALIFGSGELARSNGEVMAGWPRGSRVRVIAFSSISSSQKQAVSQAVGQWADLTNGAVSAYLEEASPRFPGPPNQIVMPFERNQIYTYAPSASDYFQVSPAGSSGCALPVVHRTTGVIERAVVVFNADEMRANIVFTAAHEFGLAHMFPSRTLGRRRRWRNSGRRR